MRTVRKEIQLLTHDLPTDKLERVEGLAGDSTTELAATHALAHLSHHV
jgi:hypothetical protein